QDEAGGIAQALALAERFANGQPMCVILGDNIFEDSINATIAEFMKDPSSAHIILKEVTDAERFGVAVISGKKITKIIEKPPEPPTNFAVTGIYCYPGDVFKIIKGLKPSARNELEITDVNNAYIEAGRLGYSMFTGYWSDAGTFPSLANANELVVAKAPNF